MTVALDAGVLIALINLTDAHAPAAAAFIESTAPPYLAHSVNMAEALVRAHREGHAPEAFNRLRDIGVTISDLGPNEPLILARVRVETGLQIPDACAFATALRAAGTLVTFDRQVAAAAEKVGLRHPASIAP